MAELRPRRNLGPASCPSLRSSPALQKASRSLTPVARGCIGRVRAAFVPRCLDAENTQKKKKIGQKKEVWGRTKIRYKAQTFSSLDLNKWGGTEIMTRLRVSHEPCGHSGGTGGGGELPRKSLNRRNRPVGPSLGQETPVPGPARRGAAEGRAGPGAGGGSSPRRGWGIAPSALILLPPRTVPAAKTQGIARETVQQKRGGLFPRMARKRERKKKKKKKISNFRMLEPVREVL